MKIFGKFFLLLNLVLPLYSCGEGESFIQDIVYNVADEDEFFASITEFFLLGLNFMCE